jgi:hypothetical protein
MKIYGYRGNESVHALYSNPKYLLLDFVILLFQKRTAAERREEMRLSLLQKKQTIQSTQTKDVVETPLSGACLDLNLKKCKNRL